MDFKKTFSKHLLLISLSGLLVMSTFLLTLIKPKTVYVEKQLNNANTEISIIPLLKDIDNYPLLTAQSVFAIDLDTSVVLYQKNPDQRVYPASTTKMVTALVALENYELDQILNTGFFISKGSSMGLEWNENISFEDLLYGLLIHSGNDAAEVLALNHEGGREGFINSMNEFAKRAYATNSNFQNPSGLDQENHYSTARDLVRIASVAMQNEVFSEIVATEEWVAENSDGTIKHYLSNRNELLGKVEGVLGVKTGFTQGARENLVTMTERDGHKIIIALLGSQDRFAESEKLIEWIFDSYEWSSVLTPKN